MDTSTTTKRLFTPAEANRTLPLVRRIVADILEIGAELKAAAEPREPGWERAPGVQKRMDQLAELMAELDAIGCSYCDWNFELGLVDFPAEIDGQDVLLCWRSDEPAVSYYHGLHTGYAGRQPIPTTLLAH